MTEVAYRRGCDMQRIPGDTAGDRVGLYKNCRVVYLVQRTPGDKSGSLLGVYKK